MAQTKLITGDVQGREGDVSTLNWALSPSCLKQLPSASHQPRAMLKMTKCNGCSGLAQSCWWVWKLSRAHAAHWWLMELPKAGERQAFIPPANSWVPDPRCPSHGWGNWSQVWDRRVKERSLWRIPSKGPGVGSFRKYFLHLRRKDDRVAFNYLKDAVQNGLWSLDGELLPQHDQSWWPGINTDNPARC